MAEFKENDIALVGFDSEKDQLMDLWFRDSIEFGHGCSLHIKIKNILYRARSEYQEIAIMETEKMARYW